MVIAVLFAATPIFLGCGKSPESTVESFYYAVSKGEITEAKGYISAILVGMLGEAKLSAALSSETESIRACGGIKSIDVKLQGEGDVRTGQATITYAGNCAAKTEKTKLVKEDGKWKISANK
jgi:hypothetical protein